MNKIVVEGVATANRKLLAWVEEVAPRLRIAPHVGSQAPFWQN
jgi:hypothetical protein